MFNYLNLEGMRKITNLFSKTLFACVIVIFALLISVKTWGQAQTIGSFPLMGGGIEEFTASASAALSS